MHSSSSQVSATFIAGARDAVEVCLEPILALLKGLEILAENQDPKVRDLKLPGMQGISVTHEAQTGLQEVARQSLSAVNLVVSSKDSRRCNV